MNKKLCMVICCFGAMAVIAAPHGHGGPKVRPPAPVRHAPAPHHVVAHRHPRGIFHRAAPPPHYHSWRRGPHPHAVYRCGWFNDVWYDEFGYPYYAPSVAAGVAVGAAIGTVVGNLLTGGDATTVVTQPAVVQQPVVVSSPVVVQQPAVVQQPVVIQQPTVVQQPVVVQQPPVVQQPVVQEITPQVQQPVVQPTQKRWVEGAYVDQVQADGTSVRVWQAGHYE